MTQYKHIVQVHPVENGKPNLAKVEQEKEFDFESMALYYVEAYNDQAMSGSNMFNAVYLGRVNDETGVEG